MKLQGAKEEIYGGYHLNNPGKGDNFSSLNPLITGYFHKASGHHAYRTSGNEYILLFCVEGKGSLFLDGRSYSINPGDLAFCFKALPHEYKADDHSPWSIYWLHFDGAVVESLLSNLGVSPQKPVISPGIHNDLKSSFLEIRNSFAAGSHYSARFRSVTWTHHLFSSLLQRVPADEVFSNHSGVEKAVHYMMDNLNSRIVLDDLAEKANMSRFHFSRVFKEQMGVSPMMHFNQLKIDKACEMLSTTDLPIKEISHILSFNTPYYFSETFKRFKSVCPEKFRIDENTLN